MTDKNTIAHQAQELAQAYIDNKLAEHARIALNDDQNAADTDALEPTILIPLSRFHTTDIVEDALEKTIASYNVNQALDYETNVLYVLANILFDNRTMMIKESASATERYLNHYQALNAAILDNIEEEIAINCDNFDDYLNEGLGAMLLHDVKEFDEYTHCREKFRLINDFMAAVSAIVNERGLTLKLHDPDNYQPLDVEMTKRGHNTLIPCWIAPHQEDNHNTEGMLLASQVRLLAHSFDGEDLDDDDAVTGALDSLLESQGYTLHKCVDVHNNDRTFPASLKREVEEMSGAFAQIAFIAVRGYISVADLDAIMRGHVNALIIPAETPGDTLAPVGLFDPVTGSGSLFEIELERDWVIPINPAILGSSFGGVHTDEEHMAGGYGYSPTNVYGYLKSSPHLKAGDSCL